MSTLIAAILCSQLSLKAPTRLNACRAATHTATAQVGLDGQFRLIAREYRYVAQEELGDPVIWGLASVYTLGVTQKLVFSFKAKPYADVISFNLKPGAYVVGLKWRL